MSKSALSGLTKAWPATSAPTHQGNPRPGRPIDTHMNPENGPAGQFLRSVTTLGHYGRADDVAALVSYLAGEGGRYITGTAITIDGGLAA